MTKSKNVVFDIFIESVSLYFKHIKPFLSYLAFPVIGQIAGAILVFTLNYHFMMVLPYLMKKFEIFNNPAFVLTLVILLALPGLAIMLKAFWDFLVAYGAINSMADNMTKSGKLYDFQAHTLVVQQRKFSFAFLWVLYSLFIFTSINPIFWIAGGLVFVFFSLVFQVFTFEVEKNVFACFKKSFDLVKGNYFKTLLLLILVASLTYFIIPEIVRILMALIGVVPFFANLIQNIVALNMQAFTPQLEILNKALIAMHQAPLDVLSISQIVVLSTIGWMTIAFLLPIRTLACYLWYKNLNKKFMAKLKKSSKKDVQM